MTPAGRRRPPARRRGGYRWPLRIGIGALLLALGVAIGQALSENPRPGGTQTLVRTLQVPTTLGPAPETVTITVQAP